MFDNSDVDSGDRPSRGHGPAGSAVPVGGDDPVSGGAGCGVDPGGLLLGELRVWMAQRYELEVFVEDHGVDGSVDVVVAGDAVCEALGLLRLALSGLDVAGAGGEAVMGTVVWLEATRRALDGVNAQLLGHLDALGTTEATVGVGVKQWKANCTHGSPATVGRELKVARTLGCFGAFAEALADGLVSVDHVVALARVCNDRTVDALVERESAIVSFAKIHRFDVYVAYLRRLVAIIDSEGSEPDCGDRDTAAMGRDFEGHLHLSLELSGHNAVEIEGIINTETDRQYRAAQREHDVAGVAIPEMGVLRARAVTELLRRGADPNPNGAKAVTSVVLAVTVDRDGRPIAAHTPDGGVVDAFSAAVLACDACFAPVIVDRANNPLNMGRSVRLFTPTQKQALVIRDGGCVFPGCDRPPRRCAAHHRVGWTQGGRTDICDGALLCARHHGLMHCGRPWTLLRACQVFCVKSSLLVG